LIKVWAGRQKQILPLPADLHGDFTPLRPGRQ